MQDNLVMDEACNQSFCIIEDEEKAYNIVQLYYHETQSASSPQEEQGILLRIDNHLQLEEIRAHLSINHIDQRKITEAEIEWIKKYSKSFRIYLNTLKILLLSMETTDVDIDSLSFEDFCVIKNRLNQHRAYLNGIHI